AYLRGERDPPPVESVNGREPEPRCPDLADVRGQERARRALELAAAGGHNLLLAGPPGIGKTMLAQRLPGILPRLPPDEALEVTRIHSVAGLLPPGRPLVTVPPFRAPHHTASVSAIVGGGPAPGAPVPPLASRRTATSSRGHCSTASTCSLPFRARARTSWAGTPARVRQRCVRVSPERASALAARGYVECPRQTSSCRRRS